MLSTVDTADKLRDFLPLVDQMVAEGLLVISDVDIVKYAHRPASPAEPATSTELQSREPQS